MSKFTFIYENGYATQTKLTYETEAYELDRVLTEFESFLRGSGFVFDGYLDIVPPDDLESLQEEFDPDAPVPDPYDVFLPGGNYTKPEEC